jgi:putative hydrolase of the HAD superfamily
VHAEVIPRRFPSLFKRDDRFIYSYRFKCAKPDTEIFHRALELIGALAQHTVFLDDNVDNVLAARGLGIKAYHFRDAFSVRDELERDGLL